MFSRIILIRKMSIDIGGMRKPYLDGSRVFDLPQLSAREPFAQFKAWFDAAKAEKSIEEPNAMCLATATKTGMPSARMLLLKEFGREEGFVFFTNYGSRKGQELIENPRAALMFYWEPIKRSVRVEGAVEKVSEDKSEAYFNSRPVGSQIGACVSDQSKVIAGRQVLTDREAELKAKHVGDGAAPVPRPECWGGFRVVPEVVEFWQGQSTRIHDRLRFRRLAEGEKFDEGTMTQAEDGWIIERLSP